MAVAAVELDNLQHAQIDTTELPTLVTHTGAVLTGEKARVAYELLSRGWASDAILVSDLIDRALPADNRSRGRFRTVLASVRFAVDPISIEPTWNTTRKEYEYHSLIPEQFKPHYHKALLDYQLAVLTSTARLSETIAEPPITVNNFLRAVELESVDGISDLGPSVLEGGVIRADLPAVFEQAAEEIPGDEDSPVDPKEGDLQAIENDPELQVAVVESRTYIQDALDQAFLDSDGSMDPVGLSLFERDCKTPSTVC